MKKGPSRFPDATRQTGGGSIVISHKPSKKLKTLRSVDEIDKSTCRKRFNLPKKLLDDGQTVNLASVPRKLRSVSSAVMKKRYSDPLSPNQINRISRCELSSGNKKLKFNPDKQQNSVTRDEEEAIAGLLALTGIDDNNEIKLNKTIPEATVSKSENLVKKHPLIDLNESRNSLNVKKVFKDVTDGNNNTRKRCSSHVYICRIIMNLQNTKGKTVNSRKESKPETTPEDVTNFNRGINLNEPITVSKTIFQEQPNGCRVQPYFGNPFCDPSQWYNPVMYKSPQSRSYVQASLHNVLASKQQQPLPFKMQQDHHPYSGYDENGVLFRVDNPTTLKLALR